MRRFSICAGLILATSLMTGCGRQIGGERMALGHVSYEKAFVTAERVMRQYFTVASADAKSGIIRSAPKPVKGGRTRLVSAPASRQVATLRIQRSGGGQIVAYASVAIEQKEEAVPSQRLGEADYTRVPNLTPIDREAATTLEQNQTWSRKSSDRALARRVLYDLRRAVAAR